MELVGWLCLSLWKVDDLVELVVKQTYCEKLKEVLEAFQ